MLMEKLLDIKAGLKCRGQFTDRAGPALEHVFGGDWLFHKSCGPGPSVNLAVGVSIRGGKTVLPERLQGRPHGCESCGSLFCWCKFSPLHLGYFGPEPESGRGCCHGDVMPSPHRLCSKLPHPFATRRWFPRWTTH